MSNVNLMCGKSFSDADQEIVDRFLELQQALVDKNSDMINEIITDDCDLAFLSGKSQSKKELISDIEEGTLNYSNFETFEPTILFDDENTASLIANVRLHAEINGSPRRWISNSVVSFQKIDEEWCLSGWDN